MARVVSLIPVMVSTVLVMVALPDLDTWRQWCLVMAIAVLVLGEKHLGDLTKGDE